MVSAFLCQCHGVLCLPGDLAEMNPEISPDSTVIIHPGVNKDGYVFLQMAILLNKPKGC